MSSVLFCLFVLIVLLLIIIYHRIKYRRIYECLRKFPGPRQIPLIGVAYNFRSPDVIIGSVLKLFYKYGSTFAVWMFMIPVVVVSDPKHIKIVLNSDSCLDKEEHYQFTREFFGDGLFLATAKTWKKNRKTINPIFHPKIVNSFVDVFVKHADELLKEMKNDIPEHELFDVDHLVMKYVKDMILETALGTDKELPIPPGFLSDVKRVIEILIQRTLQVWLHPEFIFRLFPLGREFKRLHNKLNGFALKLVEKKYAEFHSQDKDEVFSDDNNSKLILDHLFSIGNEFTIQHIINESAGIFVAGVETSSITLGYLFVLSGIYKDIQEKVVAEILDVFGESDRPICIEDLPKLQYVERVIKETLRMFPALPFVARNVNEDIDIGDYIIPKGATLMVAIALTHRNEKLWPDPLKFDPDRFLPSEAAKRHPYSYLPFSAGPRNCIGKQYGMLVMKIVATSILRKFKVDTNIKFEDIRVDLQIVAKIIGGANISIEKRYLN